MKAKFNGMDFFILILLLAALGAGSWLLTNRSQEKGQTQNAKVQLMVELTSQEESFLDLPSVGDLVVVGEKEKMQTTVTGVEVLPAKTLGYDTENGKILESEVPGRYDLRISLEGDGMETANTVEINGSAIRVGMGAAMKNKDWAGYGFVLSVDAVK